jgi:hypothetical protein
MCNNINVQHYGLPVSDSNNTTLIKNTYADNTAVFLTNEEVIKHQFHTFIMYGAAFGVTLVVQIFTALFERR